MLFRSNTIIRDTTIGNDCQVECSVLEGAFLAGVARSARQSGVDTLRLQVTMNPADEYHWTTKRAFTDPITVDIQFHDMSSGLGASLTAAYLPTFAQYRTALINDATSADDATAIGTIGPGPTDPVIGNNDIRISAANGRAVGFNTPGLLLSLQSFCNFTGDGCIGLNVSNTTTGGGAYSLLAATEHEIDEVLGLGSALRNGNVPGRIWAEDLFRYESAGVRSFATNPCVPGTPHAYFSIDGGATNLNEFNNCDNGGDYGDWITHTPSQVQDAFTNGSGNPALTLNSSEVVALDVIGYTRSTQQNVPEPFSAALLGAGLAGLALLRRRAVQ